MVTFVPVKQSQLHLSFNTGYHKKCWQCLRHRLHWPVWLHDYIESTSGQRCTTIVNRHGCWLNQPLWREFDMVLLTQVGGRHYLVSFSSAIYCDFKRMSYLYWNFWKLFKVDTVSYAFNDYYINCYFMMTVFKLQKFWQFQVMV